MKISLPDGECKECGHRTVRYYRFPTLERYCLHKTCEWELVTYPIFDLISKAQMFLRRWLSS